MENIEVLRQNGFDVSVDQDEETEETRLALSAQPISKETVFDFKGEPSVSSPSFPFFSS